MDTLSNIWDFIYDGHHGHRFGALGVPVVGIHTTDFSLGITLVIIIVIVLSLAEIWFHSLEITLVPESAVIIIAGCLIGSSTAVLKQLRIIPDDVLEFDAEILFLILIPPIIFEAGWSMEKFFFFSNIKMILLYAVFGTLLNAAGVGLIVYLCSQFLFQYELSIFTALSFGSLISAVDPVSVLAIFHDIHVNSTLNILVFGESVLNDAVSIVLFQLFSSMREHEYHTTFELYSSFVVVPLLVVLRFCIVSLGGAAVGAVIAMTCTYCTRFSSHVPILEISLVYAFGILAYILAEQLMVSGIIAELVCAMIMSRYVCMNISRSSYKVVAQLQKLLSLLSEHFTFFLLGYTLIDHIVDEFPSSFDFFMILVTLVSVLVIRFVVIFSMTLIANRRRMIRLSFRDQFVIAFGGLRGAIAFALAFIISEEVDARTSLITTTLMVIIFTIFVQGTTMRPLLSLLRIERKSEGAEEKEIAQLSLLRPLETVESVIGSILGSQDRLIRLYKKTDRIIQRIFLRKLLDAEQDIILAIRSMQEAEKTGIFDIHDQHILRKAEQSLQDPHINLERVAEATKNIEDNKYVQEFIRKSREHHQKSLDVQKLNERYSDTLGAPKAISSILPRDLGKSMDIGRPESEKIGSIEFTKGEFDKRFRSIDYPGEQPKFSKSSSTVDLFSRRSIDLTKLNANVLNAYQTKPGRTREQLRVHFAKSNYDVNEDNQKKKHTFRQSTLRNSFSNFKQNLESVVVEGVSFCLPTRISLSDFIFQKQASPTREEISGEEILELELELEDNDGFSST